MATRAQSLYKNAEAALIEGETAGINFRLKNCAALFHALQDNADALLTALRSDGAPIAAQPRQSAELTAVLSIITSTYTRIGKRGPVSAFTRNTTLQVPGGVVLIGTSTAHPFASLVVPLCAAIKDGNPALIIPPSNAKKFYNLLSQCLQSAGVDQRAFPFVKDASLDDFSSELHFSAAFLPQSIGNNARQTANICADRYATYPVGPCPVLIDQTALVGRTEYAPAFAHESTTLQNTKIPKSIAEAAKTIALARSQLGNLSAKDSMWMSSSCPSYLLVHEAILPLLMRSLANEFKALGSPITARLHSTEAAKDMMTGTVAGALDHLPVFSVSSFDFAIDLLQDDMPPHSAAYIFASGDFASYAARQLRKTLKVCINNVSHSSLTLGFFDDPAFFSATQTKKIEIASKPNAECSALPLQPPKQARLVELKRKAGFRIDFFMSGVFLSLGTVASILIGSSGYGVYLLAMRAFAWYKQNYGRL